MTVRELITVLGFKVNDQQLKDAESKTKKMAFGMKVAIGAALGGIALIGKAAISAAADMEMLTTQFEVMLGSTEAAVAMMDELKDFAAATPFALEDLATGSQQLLSFGVAQEDIIKRMRMLGDTAGGNVEKLKGLVLAYGKVTVKGKASMEELNMIAEKGLPIFEVLSTQMGVTREELFKMVSKGKVSAQDITDSFETMTTEGGMFFEGMKKQSQTFHGLVSTMKDNFKLLLADIGTGLMPVMKELVGVMTTLIQGPLKDFIGAITSLLIPILKMFSALIGPLLEALIPIFQALLNIITPLIEMFTALLIPIFKILTPLFSFFTFVMIKVGEVLQLLTPLFVFFGEVIEALAPVLEGLFEGLAVIFDALFRALSPVIKAFTFLLKAVIKPLLPVLKILGIILGAIGRVIGILVDVILRPFFEIISAIMEAIGTVLNPVLEGLMEFLEPIIELLQYLNPLFDVLGTVLRWVWDVLKVLAVPLKWVFKVLGWIIKRLFDMANTLIDALSGGTTETIRRLKREQEEQTGKLTDAQKEVKKDMFGKMPTAADSLKAGDNISSKQANVNMTNNIGIKTSGGVGDAKGAKRNMEAAAKSIFSLELQKVLINAGY